MGFGYLKRTTDGEALIWRDVTREERFFCAHLYGLIRQAGERPFIGWLNETLNARFDVDAEWEIAYEVCFYRDFWHLRGRNHDRHVKDDKMRGFLKRTFDLCLFSEKTIIIFEAKAQQGFDNDQIKSMEIDPKKVAVNTGLLETDVHLIAIASHRYTPKKSTRKVFKSGWLTWEALARRFGDATGGDPVLLSADACYPRKRSGTAKTDPKD